MARHFFDLRDGDGLHRDEVGDEFDSFEDARAQCRALLPDIARKELPDGDLCAIACDLRDGAGRGGTRRVPGQDDV